MTKHATVVAYKREHPNAAPKDIAKALSKGGVKFQAGHVSTIISTAKKTGELDEVPTPSSNGNGNGNGHIAELAHNPTATELIEGKRFAESLGGIAKAAATLNVLQLLQA